MGVFHRGLRVNVAGALLYHTRYTRHAAEAIKITCTSKTVIRKVLPLNHRTRLSRIRTVVTAVTSRNDVSHSQHPNGGVTCIVAVNRR